MCVCLHVHVCACMVQADGRDRDAMVTRLTRMTATIHSLEEQLATAKGENASLVSGEKTSIPTLSEEQCANAHM